MISYNEALKIVLREASKQLLNKERVDVSDIDGRICTADIHAAVDNQPFDNSAMDGFAMKAAELQNASPDNPVAVKVVGHIAAGELRRFEAPEIGQCYEIMTGAPLPPGCDAVVPVEKTERDDGGCVLFRDVPAVGDNIRYAGSDFRKGDVVVRKGETLSTGHILALATLGVGHVDVVRKAKVALVSTGQEIIDSFEVPLQYGQIYNSTKPYLKSAVAALGMEVAASDTVQDDPDSFRQKLTALLDQGVDICLSTGAVSAGAHDFVPAVLKDMGAEIFFHKVALRPGKPVLFARFSGAGPFYVGLPGNPAATAAGLRFFVAPLLRAIQSLPPEAPQFAVLNNDYRKGDLPLRFFMRAKCSHNAQGVREIEIPQKQQSFMVSPFTGSDAWAVIPESVSALKKGDLVEFYQ